MTKINPAILSWARESAGMDIESAARAIGLSGAQAGVRLAEMEAGEREPTRNQLLKMSEKYRRPLLTFYLAAPPAASRKTSDFRTLPQRDPAGEGLVDALVRDVRARQSLVRDALEEADEAETLAFVGSVRREDGFQALALAMTTVLGFDRNTYRAARTYDDAFKQLRDAVEKLGVYVILMGNLGHHTSNISPSFFRGLALADPVAPFIVINETDSRSAWSFTLLHELGHIFLGETGISGYESEQAIERLCDSAAAAVLLDKEELFLIDVAGQETVALAGLIAKFASERKVSRKMVAYNLLRADLVTWAVYEDLTSKFDAERAAQIRDRGEAGAPDYYVVRRHRVGNGLVRLVKRLVSDGTLTSTKAGRVLGVKPTAVGRMTERVA